jgi:hypothetical protein
MDYVRKICTRKRSGRIRHETVREMMAMERRITDEVQKRRSGRTNRMDEPSWPREVLERVPREKA